jgi:hypothetical protein
MSNREPPQHSSASVGARRLGLSDIGTSPLYTIQTAFNPSDLDPVAATRRFSLAATGWLPFHRLQRGRLRRQLLSRRDDEHRPTSMLGDLMRDAPLKRLAKSRQTARSQYDRGRADLVGGL